MSPSTPANGSKAIKPDPLAYLDQAWEALTPSAHLAAAGKSIMNAPEPHAERSSSIPLRALDSTRSDTPQTSSPASSPSTPLTHSMDTEIERQAKALDQFDRQLSQLAAKARTLGSLLDQSTARMVTDLKLHEQALQAQIALTQGQTTTDLKNARQRLRRAMHWAVLTPIVTTLIVCVLAIWAFAQLQVAEMRAAQARLEQPLHPAQQSPAANGRRRP